MWLSRMSRGMLGRSVAWRRMCSSKAVDASDLLKQMDLLDLVEGAKHGGPKFLIQFTCDADKSICTQENESDRRSTKVISKTAYEKGT